MQGVSYPHRYWVSEAPERTICKVKLPLQNGREVYRLPCRMSLWHRMQGADCSSRAAIGTLRGETMQKRPRINATARSRSRNHISDSSAASHSSPDITSDGRSMRTTRFSVPNFPQALERPLRASAGEYACAARRLRISLTLERPFHSVPGSG